VVPAHAAATIQIDSSEPHRVSSAPHLRKAKKGELAMKKLFATCLLAAAFAVPAAHAQTSEAATTTTTPGGRHNPAGMIDHRINRMNAVLALNSGQQTQIRTILTNEQTTESGFRTSMKAAHTNLKTAIQNNDAASIETLSNQIGTITGQSIASHAKTQAAIYALLSPEQQTKAQQFPELLGGGPGGPGGHGHGPR
jgi:Spy/CpxP family protein refolding chaperone